MNETLFSFARPIPRPHNQVLGLDESVSQLDLYLRRFQHNIQNIHNTHVIRTRITYPWLIHSLISKVQATLMYETGMSLCTHSGLNYYFCNVVFSNRMKFKVNAFKLTQAN